MENNSQNDNERYDLADYGRFVNYTFTEKPKTFSDRLFKYRCKFNIGAAPILASFGLIAATRYSIFRNPSNDNGTLEDIFAWVGAAILSSPLQIPTLCAGLALGMVESDQLTKERYESRRKKLELKQN